MEKTYGSKIIHCTNIKYFWESKIQRIKKICGEQKNSIFKQPLYLFNVKKSIQIQFFFSLSSDSDFLGSYRLKKKTHWLFSCRWMAVFSVNVKETRQP